MYTDLVVSNSRCSVLGAFDSCKVLPSVLKLACIQEPSTCAVHLCTDVSTGAKSMPPSLHHPVIR